MTGRQPISDSHAEMMIEAARKGDIYDNDYTQSAGLPTVMGGLRITRDQYIPKQVLYDLMHALTEPVEEVNGHEPSGYIFGSGPINVFDKKCCYNKKHLPKLLSDNPDFVSIGHTQSAKLLSNRSFSNLIRLRLLEAVQTEGTSRHEPADDDKDIDDALMGYTRDDGTVEKGIWDAVSLAFAENAHGHIITLTPWAKNDRIFVQTELPALLANERVETINGHPREFFVEEFEQYRAEGLSDQDAYAKLNRNSIMGSSQEFISNYSDDFAAGLAPHLNHEFRLMAVPGYAEWADSAEPLASNATGTGTLEADPHEAHAM